MRVGEVSLNSINSKEIRKFGIIAFLFFGCLFAVAIWTKKVWAGYLFGCLSMLGVGFILMPSRLAPVYKFWLKTGLFLGTVVNATVLILSYYLVITPSAMIKRILGGRPLPVRPDKRVQSYWVDRTEPVQPKERFTKRF